MGGVIGSYGPILAGQALEAMHLNPPELAHADADTRTVADHLHNPPLAVGQHATPR